ncbi:hypothetical protein Mmol_1263 [Methylotenera mobilis JLW8]|uniref:Uncharacterized protein n=1 Tax=Methylotenera mobilis (strain JLW8 / ATCC BAA-1282 / DSM 17540) TaxID=583345 RepID=C6WW70_METML|nr:hypothetical protein Mmol_1263 [Methylotenera mobilis JLW8]
MIIRYISSLIVGQSVLTGFELVAQLEKITLF